MISPGSPTTYCPSRVPCPFYDADDNLFRLVPSIDARSSEVAKLFDKYGLDRLVLVIDAVRAGDRTLTPPDDVHGLFSNPIVPTAVFDPGVPGNLDKNVRAAVEIDGRIGALKAEYGDDRVWVSFFSAEPYYTGFVKTIAGNPQLGLDNLGSVMWWPVSPDKLPGYQERRRGKVVFRSREPYAPRIYNYAKRRQRRPGRHRALGRITEQVHHIRGIRRGPPSGGQHRDRGCWQS